jgi:hypothetical protein
LAGLINPTTLAPLAGGLVYFYEAGTTTAKNVWSEKEKTNPFTSITLGSDGTAQYYGEGIYKVVVKTSSGTTCYTWDNVKCLADNYYIRSVSTNTTATTDDDFLIVNTDSGNITITLPAAADATHPLIIKNGGSNDVIVDGSGSETIDGSATHTNSVEDMAVLYVSNGTNWYKANDKSSSTAQLDDLTASISEINSVCDGNTASASEIVTAADGISNPPIAGDSTAGRVLRILDLDIDDATNATAVKLRTASLWNGDTNDWVDNVPSDGTPTSGFAYSSNNIIIIYDTILSGSTVAVLGVDVKTNASGTDFHVTGVKGGVAGITLSFYDRTAATYPTIGTLVDTGAIALRITYITSA